VFQSRLTLCAKLDIRDIPHHLRDTDTFLAAHLNATVMRVVMCQTSSKPHHHSINRVTTSGQYLNILLFELAKSMVCVMRSTRKLCEGYTYEGISKSFRTGHLQRELQMVQLCAIRCSYIVILWVSLVSFAVITLCVASQRVFIVVRVYFVIDSVRKLLDISLFWRSTGKEQKGKTSPCLTKHHVMKTWWGIEAHLHAFLTSVLDGGDWSASRPGRFTHEERVPLYPMDGRLGGPQNRSGARCRRGKSHHYTWRE
jgi:hypothetical protein